MAYSDVDICNIAQDLLGAEALSSIQAPVSTNERRYARQYPVQRDAELRKRRWNFSKTFHVLTPTGTPIDTGKQTLYRYQWPGDALRVIRESGSIWMPAGRQLLADTNGGTLSAWFVERKLPAEFDPLFALMLGATLAMALCEAVTQSNEKKKDAKETYEMHRREAAKANAFEMGSELIGADDNAFDWVSSRYA